MTQETRILRKGWLVFGLLGVLTILGYGFMDIDFGGGSIPSVEAWNRGVAQPYVIGGVVLVLLSYFLYRGASWVRWPIMLWFPFTFGFALAWAVSRGIGEFDVVEFLFLGLPVVAIWLWGTWRTLFKRGATNGS